MGKKIILFFLFLTLTKTLNPGIHNFFLGGGVKETLFSFFLQNIFSINKSLTISVLIKAFSPRYRYFYGQKCIYIYSILQLYFIIEWLVST